MHATVGRDQYVAGVEIRMADAGIVEGADGRADALPRYRAAVAAQQVRERSRAVDRDGQQVGAVPGAQPLVARGDRPRGRKPERLDACQQREFPEAARPVCAGPEVAILDQARDEATATVVAQHLRGCAGRRGNEPGAATARRRGGDPPGRRQGKRVEVLGARMADTRGVV